MTIKCNGENFNILRKMGSLKVGLHLYIYKLIWGSLRRKVMSAERTKDIERDNHPKFDWLIRYPLPI